jgi:hypothetical protein
VKNHGYDEYGKEWNQDVVHLEGKLTSSVVGNVVGRRLYIAQDIQQNVLLTLSKELLKHQILLFPMVYIDQTLSRGVI